jgi:hypothetical protein
MSTDLVLFRITQCLVVVSWYYTLENAELYLQRTWTNDSFVFLWFVAGIAYIPFGFVG